MDWPTVVVEAARFWLYAGTVVAAIFLVIGMDRIDDDARGAYMFRPLLVAGILLLWPMVLWRWWQLESGWDPTGLRDRPLRAAHGWAWLVLGLLIPAIFIGGLVLRQPSPDGPAPVRLDAARQ